MAQSALPIADTNHLISLWLYGIRLRHVAHGIAGERHARLARTTGVFVAVLTAVVGTALFVSVATSRNVVLKNSAAALSLLAATLGVAQVALNYPEMAVRHRQAAVDYGALRRQIEVLMVTSGPDCIDQSRLLEIRDAWTQIEQSAPTIGRFLRAKARREITAASHREKAVASPGA